MESLSSLYSAADQQSADRKRLLGQFFTIANPFRSDAFQKWWKQANKQLGPSDCIIEPFAGANNIVKLAAEIGVKRGWACYDITPPAENQVPTIPVSQRDTLREFPKGFKIAITNPPYLAKNSATRRGLQFPETSFEDLYQVALDQMLANCGWVAAIIPASFLTQRLMVERLSTVVALNCRMFDDTECPVCLALFTPEKKSDFLVYRGEEKLGSFSDLKGKLPDPRRQLPWRFNEPAGEIGLRALDGSVEASIEFVTGDAIPSAKIDHTCRSITRIKMPPGIREHPATIIRSANRLLQEYRHKTHDVFMTAFKGLRRDGDYRRRLDFTQARRLLDLAVS